MDGLTQCAVGFPVRHFLCLFSSAVFSPQLIQNSSVAFPCKEIAATCSVKMLRVVVKRRELIGQCHRADLRVKVMYRIDGAAQMSNCRNTGAAPWVMPPRSTIGRKEQGAIVAQL